MVILKEEGFKVTITRLLAIETLQSAAEAFISDFFAAFVDDMVHAKLKTLMPQWSKQEGERQGSVGCSLLHLCLRQ